MTETLWRCSGCGKWSHAKRKPTAHERFVRVGEISDAELDGEQYAAGRPVKSWQRDWRGDDVVGAIVYCGPFEEYRAELVG